tara:strand:- start:1645 stop:4131 length:2487 start_codon:yes stop_codon:yes gene_type:complete
MARFGLQAFLLTSVSVGVLVPTGALAHDAAREADQTDLSSTQDGQDTDPEMAPPADQGDTIVVTARRQSETLLEVPVSVSVVDSEMLESANISDLADIGRLVPTVQLARGASGSGGTLGIRGVSAAYTDAGVDSPVSISIDGAQFSRNYISQIASFDLASVQVLRGPQALFFGKNSPAGVIVLTSNDPGPTTEIMMRGGYEFEADEYILEGVVSVPLSDKFGVRLAARYSDMQGYFYNQAQPLANPFPDAAIVPTYPGAVTNQRTPDASSLGARATLLFDSPEDDFTARFKFLYANYRNNEATGDFQTFYCTGGGADEAGFIDPFDDCIANDTRSLSNQPLPFSVGIPFAEDGEYGMDNEAVLATLDLEKTFGAVNLVSQTSLFDGSNFGTGCYTYSYFCRLMGVNGEDSRIFSQELRAHVEVASNLSVMVGGYFEWFERTNTTYLFLPGAAVPVVPDARNGRTYASQVVETTKGETNSVFAQAQWDITPTLEFAAGVRYTDETKDGVFNNVYRNESNPVARAVLAPVGTFVFPDFAEDDFSPEATLTWRMTPSQTIYAAYRTGYKSGGFSTPALLLNSVVAAGEQSLEFGSESAEGGEIGYRADLADGLFSVSAAAYYYEFSGLQRSALDIATLNFIVRNAASAVTKGVEIETTVNPADGFTLRGAVAYNDASYDSYQNAPCYTPTAAECTTDPVSGRQVLDLSGFPLSRAPEWTLQGSASYDLPIGNDFLINLNANMRYVSEYLTQEDGNPNAVQPGYATIGAGITFGEIDGKWALALIGRNLTNEYAVLYSAAKPGSVAVPGLGPDLVGFVDRPREVLVQATVRF